MLLAVLAACSPGRPAVSEPAWTSVVATPLRREGAIDVTPAELGDEASVERMRHRVRLKQIGRAWTRLDAAPLSDSAPGEGDPIDELLPAIGETANRIRVVTEEDGARVAVWIDRREAWDSIVAPLKLPRDGAAAGAGQGREAPAGGAVGDAGAGSPGVWLDAGAPVEVARGRARAGRPVELHDETVAILGSVPAAFLGHVWIVPHDDRRPTDMAQGSCSTTTTPTPPPPDRRGQMSLAEGAAIRAAASETAPVLATLREAVDVTVVARGADWAEIELRRPYARVRGHVPASDLTPTEELGELSGSCTGRMFTMSHADRIDVPAGTCLFDRANGDVVGVATETMVRLGTRGRAGDEWSMVHVNTRWSLASLYVRDTGRDPAQLALESCAPGRHRR